MSLDRAIALAQAATAADRRGDRSAAKDCFVEAAAQLLGVIKAEPDAARAAKLAARMKSYVARAEQLSVVVRPPPPPKRQPPRARASTTTDYFSADEGFRKDVATARQACRAIEAQTSDYEDAGFRGAKALGKGKGVDKVVGWRRARELASKVFDGDPKPRDVGQGALGDCWLLSSLSVLAHFPELVRRVLVTAELSKRGVYACRLCRAGEWRVVYVDDLLPVRRDGLCAFCQVTVLWPALVEKACAKLFGGYGCLDQGNAAEALGLLTGLPTEVVPCDANDLCTTLSKAHRAGFVLSASCGKDDVHESVYERVGLLSAHEYAILRMEALPDGRRLIQLRNPWGAHEWKGPWSRHASQWRALPPSVVAACNAKGSLNTDDGVFWMAPADFAKFFRETTVCRLRRNFSQARWPVHTPTSLDAPASAFEIRCTKDTVLDAALLQRTGRGLGKHHVMGDALLLILESASDFSRVSLVAGRATLAQEAVAQRSTLPSVAAPGVLQLKAGRAYAVVPLCLNWRCLGLARQLTAVLYASQALEDVRALGLTSDALAACLRLAILDGGSLLSKKDTDMKIHELDGLFLAENHTKDAHVTVTLGLGRAENLISSRHAGVIDPSKPGATYAVEDTLPPRTWQILLARSPFKGSWSIENTSVKWSTSADRERHHPPVEKGGLHACYPLYFS